MKKVLFGFAILAASAMMVSCGNKSAQNAEGQDSTAVAEAVDKASANPTEALTALVEKAKAEGANWSVDQWKDAYRQVMSVMAPSLKEIFALTESIKTEDGKEPDGAKVAEVIGKMSELQKKFEPLEKLMEEFSEISKNSVNGKAVEEDKEFEAQIKKEFGLPEDF